MSLYRILDLAIDNQTLYIMVSSSNFDNNEVKLIELPVLYSFRRCPYAMRARIALMLADISVILREVDLKKKPKELLEISPKGTVPVLVLPTGKIIEESLEIMNFALPKESHVAQTNHLIDELRDFMVPALMRYKYPNHYEDVNRSEEQNKIAEYFKKLNDQLSDSAFLFGDQIGKADIAILPFIRQTHKVDDSWMTGLPYEHLKKWLFDFLESDLHTLMMRKVPVWESTQTDIILSAK